MEDVLLVAGIGAVLLFSTVLWMRTRHEQPKLQQNHHRKRHRTLSASQEWHGVNWAAWSAPQRRSSRRQKPQGVQTLLFLPPPKPE